MPVMSLDPRQFMQPKLIEGVVNKKLEETLSFINMFPVVPTDATSVTYSEDLTTAGADITAGTMGKPLDIGELGALTKISVSPITQKHGMLRPFGYEFRVSKRDIERTQVIDDLNRGIARAAFGMARRINDDIVSILKNATNDITEPGSAWTAWSSADATPISNIIDICNAMDVNGYESEATDLFLQQTNYYELLDYLQNIDINWVIDPKGGPDRRAIPRINGLDVHKLRGTSELAEGAYMALDTRPQFAPVTVYAHSQSGMGKDGSFPIINVNQYSEQAYPHNVVTEFVAETFYALKAPNSVCYRSSGV